ncbi:MAG TPA: hypothetical protein P5057_07010, partial [Acidobacteriota bacterium]|nr:hypothetical protein [Acidobacteriota bacterium]
MRGWNWIAVGLLTPIPLLGVPAAEELQLTDTEYLASPTLDVLFFHNSYPEGKQGGVEFIH